jgi:hypothetical protein
MKLSPPTPLPRRISTMGFQLGRTYVLKFTDSALDGAEVRLRSTSIGTTMKLREPDLPWPALIQMLIDHVIDWNFTTQDDEPLPVTSEAVSAHMEQVVLLRIVREWMRAATGISAPLDPPSTDGTQDSQETSLDLTEIPMDTLGNPEN